MNQSTESMRQNAPRYKNMGWTGLPFRDVTVIKEMLSNNTPVIMRIPVYPDFDNLNSSNEIYDNLDGALRARHAITLIEYDDEKNVFKFINQWGTSWGVSGYGWISYSLIQNNDFESYIMYDDVNSVYEYAWGGYINCR